MKLLAKRKQAGQKYLNLMHRHVFADKRTDRQSASVTNRNSDLNALLMSKCKKYTIYN